MSQAESHPNWKRLYRVGGGAALLAVGFEVANALISVIFSGSNPIPSTVLGWFTLLEHDRFLGLLDLGLLDIAAVALLVPMFLAVYLALRRTSPSLMAIATAFAFVGIGIYLATETAFSLLSLSTQHAAATTNAQRTLLEAAGQAMLAEQAGVGAGAYMAFFLMGVAGLIISVIMWRSALFSTVTAPVGILANGILLVYYIGLAFVPIPLTIGVPLYWASGLLSLIWYLLIGRRLLMLVQNISKEEAKQPAVAEASETHAGQGV